MTALGLPDRDGATVEALVADRYLDALLAAADRHALDTPGDAALDPALREAARVLRRSLVRVHPSFRFEERLAARLADLAAAQVATGLVPPGGGTLIAFPAGEAGPDTAATGPGRRPLIVGGAAITSAALSIVGVAIVAWRASRPGARAATLAGLTRGPA